MWSKPIAAGLSTGHRQHHAQQFGTPLVGRSQLLVVLPHRTCGTRPTIQADAAPSVVEVQQSVRSSQALMRVASLASAWAKVSRRLPAQPSGSSDVSSIIRGLRIAMLVLEGTTRRDGRDAFSRALQLAVTLAELSAVGLPLDVDGIAAACIADAASGEDHHMQVDHHHIRQKLGDTVASLVHDILRVRTAPQRVELFDDTAASAIREWCIAAHDVRACVVEVVSRWDELQHMSGLPMYEQQQLALEALQVYAPLGHALGMGAVSASMEDACFQVLFPESYQHTSEWLHNVVDPAEDALYAAQQQLLKALDNNPRFNQLASSCVLRARTKSLFSMMKKLLRLGDMAKGGRKHDEVFDLLGMRAIVQPRTDLPAEEAERAAVEACYIVQQVAQELWTVMPGRTKDYIQSPKPNGYRCIHLTICMHSVMQATETRYPNDPQGQDSRPTSSTHDGNRPGVAVDPTGEQQEVAAAASTSPVSNVSSNIAAGSGSLGSAPFLELQIRTHSMDELAEQGDAAHTAYKGGLDSRQARQLQAWSQELHTRLAIKPQGKLSLPPSIVAQQMGMGSPLESVDSGDLDADATLQGADASSSPQAASSSSGSSSASLVVRGLSVQPGGQSPAEQLFREFDSNGDGRISLEELRDQLREVAAGNWQGPGGWINPYGPAGFAGYDASSTGLSWSGGASALSFGQGSYAGGYESMATFDELGTGVWARGVPAAGPAGGQLADAGSGSGSVDQAELDRLLRALAGEHEDVDMSLDEFATFLQQAGALRKSKLRQQGKLEQQQRERQRWHAEQQ